MTESREVRLGDLTVVREERRAFYREAEITLTPREFDILATLTARPGWVFSAEQLADTDDPLRYASPSAVNVHVSHLRAKLADAGANGLVATVQGVGWKMSPETQAALAAPVSAFVGRQDELRVLAEALAPGTGRFVLIRGEPGIGKTSLAEQFIAMTAPRFEVVRIVCDGNGSGDHWLWRQMLRRIESVTGKELDAGVYGAVLTRLIGASTAAPRESLRGADRTLGYEAVTRYLESALGSHSRPTLLFIDDLQLADEASLKLLAYLLKRLPAIHCGLVAACREGDLLTREPLRPMLDYATQRRDAAVLSLTGLPSQDVAAMVETSLGTDIAGTLCQDLEERTGGNPLFLGEFLRIVRDTGKSPADLEDEVGSAVASLVDSQVQRLPEETRQLLKFAAVFAGEFDPEMVALAAGGATGASAFEPAIDVRVLVREAHCLRFRHALIRDALLASVPLAEQETHHRQVADALHRFYGGSHRRIYLMAHHSARAGVAARASAIGYLISAARIALSRFAYEDSLAHLEEALQLLPSAQLDPARARRVRSCVMERIGMTCTALGDYRGARVAYEESVEARPRADVFGRTRVLTRLGKACGYDRSRAGYTKAFAAALTTLATWTDRDTPWWRAWIDVRLGQLEAASTGGTAPPFVDLRSEMEEVVLRHGTTGQRSLYHLELANRLSIEARWRVSDEILQVARMALDESTSDGSVDLQSWSAQFLGSLLIYRGRPSDAEPYLRQALDVAQRCAYGLDEAACRFFLAMGARLAGDVLSAESHALELERLVSSRESLPEFKSGADAVLGWVALRRGYMEQAEDRSQRALRVWEEDPACSQSVWMMAWPAISCAIAREDFGATFELAALMTRPDQQVLQDDLDSRLQEAVALHRRGNTARAARLLARLEVHAREFGYV